MDSNDKKWEDLSLEERKKRLFTSRVNRLNKLIELKAPEVVLLNEAILIAKACLPGDDISTKVLIKYLLERKD